MWTLCVVPKKPFDEELVEVRKIVPEELTIAHNAVFRDRPVEAFNVTIHIRASWIRVVSGEVKTGTCIVEVSSKLRAVVGLECRYRGK